jgi:hypothetical protein
VSERLEDLVEGVKTQADSGHAVKSERQHIYRIRGEVLVHVRAGGTAYQSHPPPGEHGENQSEKQDHKDHNEGYGYVHVHGIIIAQVLVLGLVLVEIPERRIGKEEGVIFNLSSSSILLPSYFY